MNKVLMLIGLLIPFITKTQPGKFDNYPVYIDTDLGLQYTPQQSFFRIWSPTANEAELRLYNEGIGGEAIQTINKLVP